MIFLDANAFYSYFGRTRLGMSSSPVDEKRLRKYLDVQKDKSLPTSVFIEIVTHFRNAPKLLKELLEFSQEKRILIYNNIPDYVISEDELTCVAFMDEIGLKHYADRLLENKIRIESKFTLLFFEITRDLYTHYRLEQTTELSKQNKKAILEYICKNGYKEYGKILEKKIQKKLQSGYEDNDEKKILKDFYIQELNEACILTDVIIAACVACNNKEDDIIGVIQKAYQRELVLGMDGYNSTMSCIVDTLTQNQQFLCLAKTNISEMFKKGNYTKTQRIYLRDVMFTAWFERAKKIEKNDIFDMFCVGCLDKEDVKKEKCILIDNSPYIISFDKTMKSFIGTIKKENLMLIEKIQII